MLIFLERNERRHGYNSDVRLCASLLDFGGCRCREHYYCINISESESRRQRLDIISEVVVCSLSLFLSFPGKNIHLKGTFSLLFFCLMINNICIEQMGQRVWLNKLTLNNCCILQDPCSLVKKRKKYVSRVLLSFLSLFPSARPSSASFLCRNTKCFAWRPHKQASKLVIIFREGNTERDGVSEWAI